MTTKKKTPQKKKIAFICAKGLETFVEPIAKEFEKKPAFHVRRYYVTTQQEVIAAVKWSDYVFLEWANEIAAIATQLYEMKKKGAICRLHSYEALTSLPTKIDWSVVDYLVFAAPHIKDILKRQIPDIKKRVCTKVIPNGLDLQNIRLNEKTDIHDIAYVCNINHKKEPALALQIMAGLKDRYPNTTYRLHIAGAHQDDRYQIYMEHMAKEMGIEDNIIYYGFVDDMETFWEGKGIILSTSIHEGHPLNVMEGAARGIHPVVHNFMGADAMYPKDWLFNTVDEALDLIVTPDVPIIDRRQEYRDHIIDRKWTLGNQVKQLTALFNRLGKKA